MGMFTRSRALTGALGLVMAVVAPMADAATITVTNTNDSGAGSLRAAITAANGTTAADIIAFDIPGQGPFTIAPTSSLPMITQPVLIDGYSQTGAFANSDATASNARIQIRLDGANVSSTTDGLTICTNDATIRGLSITRFSRHGVVVGGSIFGCALQPANVDITGNFIGLLPDGSTLGGNGFIGIEVLTSGVTIGGNTLASRNVISGNQLGIELSAAFNGSSVLNNLVGTDASGLLDRGQSGPGIVLRASTDNVTIGTAAAPNVVAFNSVGISVGLTSEADTVFANHVFGNSGLGIDLNASNVVNDGVTENDSNDVDTGGNELQNFPVIAAITRLNSGLHILAVLDRVSTAGSRTYIIGVYANSACDASGNGEGERFLGTFNFVSASPSAETISADFTTNEPLPIGSRITLTATDQATGSTSEFSDCASIDNTTPLVVTSTANTLGSICGTVCTLAQAIAAANATPGGDTIRFNIPVSGILVIQPTGPLPLITEAVTIDGYTQPGTSPNTLADTDNAVIRVVLDGTNAGSAVAMPVCASNVTVRGLSIVAYGNHAIAMGLQSSLADCPDPPFVGGVIEGNFIGVSTTGGPGFNGGDAIIVNDYSVDIGGATPAARNVLGKGDNGIRFDSGSSGRVDNNFIGVGIDGVANRGNIESGVRIQTGNNAIISVGTRARNRIGFNRQGVLLTSGSTRADVAMNEFGGNTAIGIDLVASGATSDGVTANDIDDTDTGGNNLQNFPLLTSATQLGSTLRVSGVLDVGAGAPTQAHQYAFYASASCDASGNGEGEVFLGRVARQTTSGTENFTIDLNASAPIGAAITSTVTFVGNTSEFSNCVTLVDGDPVFKDQFE